MLHSHVARASIAALTLCGLIATTNAAELTPSQPITNINNWARVVRTPAKRPLDIVIIAGDSTIVVNQGGQARAIHEVMRERYPAFATSFTPPGINNGAGVALNMGWDWADSGVDQTIGATGHFDDLFQRTSSTPFVKEGHFSRYGFIPANLPPSALYGAQLGPASGIDLRHAIRFETWYSSGPAITTSFCPQVRYNIDLVGPYQSLSGSVITDAVSATSPADHIASYSVVLPADPTRSATRSMYWNVGGNIQLWSGVTGPMTFYGVRAYAEDVHNGYSLSIVDQAGSESDYGFAVRARDWLERGVDPVSGTSPSYQLIIGALRARQIAMGFEPRILLIIEGLGNSISYTGPSINGRAPNNTPVGVEDNVTDIYNRWEKFRSKAGFASSEFSYLIVGFTVVLDPAKEKTFSSYRNRLATWSRSRPNVSFLDWSGFMTTADTHAWSTVDDVHLSLTGYKTLWRRAIDYGLNHAIQFRDAGD